MVVAHFQERVVREGGGSPLSGRDYAAERVGLGFTQTRNQWTLKKIQERQTWGNSKGQEYTNCARTAENQSARLNREG